MANDDPLRPQRRPLDRYDLAPPAVPTIPPNAGEPADRTHADFLKACEDARVFPERCFLGARTDERTTARRAVACRLLHAGWRPKRIATLFSASVREVYNWSRQCPQGMDTRTWRPPPGVSYTSYGRKLRRAKS